MYDITILTATSTDPAANTSYDKRDDEKRGNANPKWKTAIRIETANKNINQYTRMCHMIQL